MGWKSTPIPTGLLPLKAWEALVQAQTLWDPNISSFFKPRATNRITWVFVVTFCWPKPSRLNLPWLLNAHENSVLICLFRFPPQRSLFLFSMLFLKIWASLDTPVLLCWQPDTKRMAEARGRLWWSWEKGSFPDSVPHTVTPHRDCALSPVQPITSTPLLASLQSPNSSQALVEKGTVAIHTASSPDADLGSQDPTGTTILLRVWV